MDSVVRTDQLGRALTWSLVAHGAIAFFVIVKSLVFPGQPLLVTPALRVDVVGLPDTLKKDLSQVPKKLPDEALQEQLEAAAKKAKNVKPVEVPKEAAAPDEMVLNPKKSKAEKTAKEKEKKLDAALARIRALERLKDKEAIEKEERDAVIIKGNQISKGTSLSGDARERAEASYYDLVRDQLVEFWALPTWLARQKLSAQVLITVDRAGNILSTKFVRPSGNEQFDAAIRGTLRDAAPLPKPPANIADTVADEGIIVGFPL